MKTVMLVIVTKVGKRRTIDTSLSDRNNLIQVNQFQLQFSLLHKDLMSQESDASDDEREMLHRYILVIMMQM